MDADSPKGSERRAVARESTLRTAYFSILSGDSPLVEGRVLDISPNGLQLESAQSTVQGQRLEIELHPRHGKSASDVLLIRGQVAWVSNSGAGTFAMGVEFLLRSPGQTTTMSGHQGLQAREAYSKTLQRHLDHLDRDEPVGQEDAGTIERRPTRVPATGRKRGDTWRLLLLLFLLLLLALALLWMVLRLWPAEKGGAGLNVFSRFGNVTAEEPPDEAERPPGELRGDGVDLTRAKALVPQARLAAAQTALADGELEAAGILFQDVARDPESSEMERFSAGLGQGFVDFASGGKAEAIAGLSELLNGYPNVPAPWQEKARDLRRAFVQFADVESLPYPWSDALELSPLDEAPDAGSAQRRIEVDIDAYTLKVMEGENTLAAFAVGLGVDGSTPEGDFFVANKIKNPDWYNRGDVVKAGDPRNPLGAYWVGLADESGPMPIGIHPTESPGAILNDESRGCIRLFPEDAARVFGLCQVGTPVRIFRGAASD